MNEIYRFNLLGHQYTDNQYAVPASEHWLLRDIEDKPVVHRHEDVMAILRDSRFMRSPVGEEYAEDLKQVYPNLFWMLENSPSENSELGDPEQHKKSRQFFNMAFSKASLENWYEQIELVGRDYAQRLWSCKGRVNLYDVLKTYPFTVSTKIFGIDFTEEQIVQFQAYAGDFLSAYALVYSENIDPQYIANQAEKAERAIEGSRALFADWFQSAEAQAEENPAIKNFIDAYNASDFDDEQKLAALISILVASADTVGVTSCLMMRTLLRFPERVAELKEAISNGDEALLDRATWEIIRYDAASCGIMRFPKEDVEYKGVVFQKDQMVFLSNLMADRDEAFYPDPLTLNFHRDNSDRLLEFGFGMRSCPGKFLAHKELKELLRNTVKLMPEGTQLINEGDAEWESRHYIVRFLKQLLIYIPE